MGFFGIACGEPQNDGEKITPISHRHPERMRRIPPGRRLGWKSRGDLRVKPEDAGSLYLKRLVVVPMGFFGSPAMSLRMTSFPHRQNDGENSLRATRKRC